MGRRAARIGIGAGLLGLFTAAAVKIRGAARKRRAARRARAEEARRNMWPPVPVKPGAEAHIDASRAGGE